MRGIVGQRGTRHGGERPDRTAVDDHAQIGVAHFEGERRAAPAGRGKAEVREHRGAADRHPPVTGRVDRTGSGVPADVHQPANLAGLAGHAAVEPPKLVVSQQAGAETGRRLAQRRSERRRRRLVAAFDQDSAQRDQLLKQSHALGRYGRDRWIVARRRLERLRQEGLRLSQALGAAAQQQGRQQEPARGGHGSGRETRGAGTMRQVTNLCRQCCFKTSAKVIVRPSQQEIRMQHPGRHAIARDVEAPEAWMPLRVGLEPRLDQLARVQGCKLVAGGA